MARPAKLALARHKVQAPVGHDHFRRAPTQPAKAGPIRRITGALDARRYQSIPIAAPTEEELLALFVAFLRHLPRLGRFALYDRSWYGRVLVDRVEGLCAEADWMRAYSEINDFEEQLVLKGTVVAKFWLQIDKAEQLKRFKLGEKTSFKRYCQTAHGRYPPALRLFDNWRHFGC